MKPAAAIAKAEAHDAMKARLAALEKMREALMNMQTTPGFRNKAFQDGFVRCLTRVREICGRVK